MSARLLGSEGCKAAPSNGKYAKESPEQAASQIHAESTKGKVNGERPKIPEHTAPMEAVRTLEHAPMKTTAAIIWKKCNEN